jgi:hypothetical protein
VSFTLSLQNATAGTGVTYQWQTSPDGLVWTNATGTSTNATYSATQSVATYYQCIVTCSGSPATSTPVLVGQNAPTACYCIPTTTFGCTDGDVIARVILNTLDNNSGTGCPSGLLGYSNYTTDPLLTTTLNAGTSYSCTVFAGQYSEGYAAWIDYNDDGLFDNSTERIGFSAGQVAGSGQVGVLGSSATFPVVLACNPPVGTHRLRVRAMYATNGSAVTPCTNNTYGEVEDYNVTIAPPPPCPAVSALVASGPSNNSVNLAWAVGCTETAWEIEYGAPGFALGTGTIVAAGTNPYVLGGLAQLSSYDVYVRASCGGNGVSSSTGPVAVTTLGPPSCVAAPTSPADLGIGCAGGVTLSWPSALNATGYDVILDGLTVATNQAGTTYAAGVLPAGPHTWSVIPQNVYGIAAGCATWSFTITGAPAGDTQGTALAVGTLPASIAGDNLASNCWTSTYAGTNAQSSADVWYTLTTGPCGGVLSVDLCGAGSLADSYLHLMDATGATELAFNDDNGPLCASAKASLTYAVTANTTYLIVVEGFSSNTGTYTLTVSQTQTDTDGDGVCDGLDNCPTVVGQIGSVCSDGNACTINDVLDATCACVGTPIAPPAIASTTATPATICSGSSSQLAVVLAGTAPYCSTSYTSGTGFGDYCTLVSVAGTTLNSVSGASASPYYTLFPASGSTTATFAVGTPYVLTLSAGTYTVNDFAVWIDYNNDGIFTDATEKLGQVNNIGAAPATATISFTVPATATNGALRMRVREADQGSTSTLPACGGLEYGEVEDYTVTVTGGVPPPTYSWAPATFLNDATFANPIASNITATTPYTVTVSDAIGCSSTGSVTVTVSTVDTDGDGVCDLDDNCPTTPGQIGSACSDGNACTINDVLDANCACVGTSVTPPAIASTTATPSTVCSGSSSQLNVALAAATYCSTSYTTGTGFGDYCTLVSVAGTSLNSVSGASASPYYTLFPASGSTTATFAVGTPYVLTLSAGTFSQNDFAVWIDYNNDGIFTDATEKLGQVNNIGAAPATTTINFTVPATATNGALRMRVREADQGSANALPACGSLSFGEVEDYTVTVTGGVPAALTYSWAPATFLNDATIANPTASNMTATTAYTVTVSDGIGCSSTGTVTVTVETTDTDGDGTADCADGCPTDPLKIAPGICGCGVADTDTDLDGTADCNDLCPLDPNKVAPGICGCGVSDVDTDNDGTADCNDGCPLDANKLAPGVCGCGVADVDTDGDGLADCIDSCPLVAGVIGTPCDDLNANTINDVLSASCVCEGTLVINCPDNLVFLDISTDNNGAQTSWEIIPQGGGAAVCSGSGLASNSLITANCCLPNGSYSLRVLDSFGDGMASGPVGGYLLRDNNGKRIIDNAGDGIFGFTSQAPDFFHVPISADRLTTATCDQESVAPSYVIQAQENLAVSGQLGVTSSTSGYQFWIFNPDGGYSRRITQTLASPGSSFPTGTLQALRPTYLRLNSLTTNPVPPYVLLNVRVRIQSAGVFGQFGSACRLKVDPPCGTTQLTTLGQPSNPAASCGATGVVINGGLLYADVINGANRYQFEFTRPGYSRLIAVNSRTLTLSNWANKPLLCGLSYTVRVRASFDNGATWCAYGSACTITTESCPAIAGGDHRDLITVDGSDLTVWPNPNRGESLRLSIEDLGATYTTANVDITDLFGKRVMAQTIAVQGNTLNTVLELTDMAAGMYMVNVTVGEKTYMKRLMVQ